MKSFLKLSAKSAFVALVFSTFSSAINASPVKFGFTNPGFGGSPFNSTYFIAMADKQNTHKPEDPTEVDPTSVEGFKKQLQQQLISTTASKIAKIVNDTDNPLTDAVTYNIDDLEITISPINPDTGTYQITITDATGSTTIDVSSGSFL